MVREAIQRGVLTATGEDPMAVLARDGDTVTKVLKEAIPLLGEGGLVYTGSAAERDTLSFLTSHLPEGWKAVVSGNALGAHYHDGMSAVHEFSVPTIYLWLFFSHGKRVVDHTTLGGFIRHADGCCQVCGCLLENSWECSYCGAV